MKSWMHVPYLIVIVLLGTLWLRSEPSDGESAPAPTADTQQALQTTSSSPENPGNDTQATINELEAKVERLQQQLVLAQHTPTASDDNSQQDLHPQSTTPQPRATPATNQAAQTDIEALYMEHREAQREARNQRFAASTPDAEGDLYAQKIESTLYSEMDLYFIGDIDIDCRATLCNITLSTNDDFQLGQHNVRAFDLFQATGLQTDMISTYSSKEAIKIEADIRPPDPD